MKIWLRRLFRTFAAGRLRPFLVTSGVVVTVLLFANFIRQIAIKEEWVLFGLSMTAVLGAVSVWTHISKKHKDLLDRSVKNDVMGALVPLCCIFFILIFLGSVSRGKWLEAANVLIAAMAALWVFFNDLVTDSNNRDEKAREKHLLRYSRTAVTHIFVCLVMLAAIGVSAAAPMQPVIKIGVSLPFSTVDQVKNSMPIYEAFRQACADHIAQPCLRTKNYRIDLVLFDDSQIGSKDCRQRDGCDITLISQAQLDKINKVVAEYDTVTEPIKQKLQVAEQSFSVANESFFARVSHESYQLSDSSESHPSSRQLTDTESELASKQDYYNTLVESFKNEGVSTSFQDFIHTPNLAAVLGPFNSGVAVQEIPALSELGIPLVSSSNTADCLTDPAFADGECDANTLGGQGYYFRTISTDLTRNDLFGRYAHDLFPEDLTADDVLIFEQSGPKENFFARSFTKTFVRGLQKATGVSADSFGSPRVLLVANNTPQKELNNKACSLAVAPKLVVYSGTGELNSKIYHAMDCARLRAAGTKYLSSGAAEKFMDAPRKTNEIYAIDGALITDEQQAEEKLPKKDFPGSREYAALAYDASNMLLMAVSDATDILISTEDPWNLRSFSFNRVNLPKALALSSRLSAVGLLHLNDDVAARLNRPLHEITAVKMGKSNTTANNHQEFLTGTYSFNDTGDAHGAAGATVRTFCPASPGRAAHWTKVADSNSYPRLNFKCPIL